MREFTTAVLDAHDEPEEDADQIKIDDRICTFHRPTDGQVAMYLSGVGRHTSTFEKVAAGVDLFIGMFDEADQAWLSGRLLDREDRFGMDAIMTILHSMIEEWSGTPTQPRSDSAGSRTPTGRKSTRRTPVSIS